MPLSAKNTCAPHQNDSAGAAALNISRQIRIAPSGSAALARYDITRLSMAIVTVAGAGPNSRAEVMKNVSEIENQTLVPAMRSGNRPVAMASTASISHSRGFGVD